ncbi:MULTISPECIES: hypothetical protein [unclassified Mycobacterium]|uniref:hypothetical protein n=1 Tax=unclassified Mycobacterium TaxID=2642494 RepID=UPI0008024B5D|nr:MULTISPECIES: hypothetical protein [unclassified Mycobacterium]OBG60521.1 hypothetical protein A5704_19100 [Mycobacterium sp. E735]OBG62655.1 hypothetical protein A5703_20675 [Mycobacterium sp. E188]OBH34072.1 hypothetical protein A5691_08910 [Mycobacterium sp. E183]
MNHVLLMASALADGAPQHTGPDFGKASPIGLLIVVLLLIATLLLLRSMNRQLKKVPKSFDPELDQAADERTEGVDGADGQPPDQAKGSQRPPGPGDEPG